MSRSETSSLSRLCDVGEFALIRDHLFPALGALATPLGSDCTIVPLSAEISLALTADPGPRPAAWLLPDVPMDLADAGWLAVVANASDLATVGAKPLAITNTINAPADMRVADLERYARGLADACAEFGFLHGGGDIGRSASDVFTSQVTAIGIVTPGFAPGRTGATIGDEAILVGSMGRFVTAYLRALRLGLAALDQDGRQALLRSRPQLDGMRRLVEHGLVKAASDCSDGVLGALWNIAEANDCHLEIDLDTIPLPKDMAAEAAAHGLSPWNLLFFWGDWQVVAIIPSGIGDFPWPVRRLGRVVEGTCGVDLRRNGQRHASAPLRNEHFLPQGFSTDPQAHIRYMLETKLF